MATVVKAIPPGGLFRLGRRPDPCALLPEEVLASPARDRFDDPERVFRVLYAYENGFRGICYESRWASECTNWAFFEPVSPRIIEMHQLDPARDRDVQRALKSLD